MNLQHCQITSFEEIFKLNYSQVGIIESSILERLLDYLRQQMNRRGIQIDADKTYTLFDNIV